MSAAPKATPKQKQNQNGHKLHRQARQRSKAQRLFNFFDLQLEAYSLQLEVFPLIFKIKTKKLIRQTEQEYNRVIGVCKDLFLKKTQDYGTAWRILRLPSITDQIFIKAQRIRSVQEKGTQKIQDDISTEFVGIINYSLIALIQLSLPADADMNLSVAEVERLYEEQVEKTRQLQRDKNHDYGEAWRDMRVSSITDIILMKLFRTKQIEDNAGQTIVSEGVDANYRDMINYAVFALIKLNFAA
jgi:hypothetical protein